HHPSEADDFAFRFVVTKSPVSGSRFRTQIARSDPAFFAFQCNHEMCRPHFAARDTSVGLRPYSTCGSLHETTRPAMQNDVASGDQPGVWQRFATKWAIRPNVRPHIALRGTGPALGEGPSIANTPLAYSAADRNGVRNRAANPTSVRL